MSTPAKTCTIGSPVSDGFIVIYKEGGPIWAIKDHTLDLKLTLDLSVAITFAQVDLMYFCRQQTVGLENGTRLLSS